MKKYVSLKDIVDDDKYPFSMGQIRALIANRHTNGLSQCIRKIGRRIYIRDDLFDQWMDSHSDNDVKKKDIKNINEKADKKKISTKPLKCPKSSKNGRFIKKQESKPDSINLI